MIVSVVIPAYNRAMTIKRAIESVLKQSFQNFEIIVVDDASTDDTKDQVKSFKDTRIRWIQHPKNQGAASARNTGIKEALGRYIAFLDSDDEWLEDKLSIQLTSMMEEQDLPTNVSCTGFILNLLDDHKTIINDLTHHQKVIDHIVKGCDLSPGSTLIVKKSIFEEIGLFDERLKRLEDWDWLLRYFKMKGNIELIYQPLAIIYNKRGRQGEVLEQSIPIFIENNLKLFKQFGFWKKRQIISDIWLQAVGTYRREKKYYKALKSLMMALSWDPFILLRYCIQKCQ